MPNDWTRPLTLSGVMRQNRGNLNAGDATEKTKPKDWLNRSIRSRTTDNENSEQIRKSTIHRLVTPEGFQLCTSTTANPRSDQSHIEINEEFKQPLQQQHPNERKIQQPDDQLENVEVIPVSRTRFSRATRSPLKNNALPIVYCPENRIPEGKVTGTKNGLGDKNRCRTCHKVYLGRRKVMRHLKAFPEHDMPIPQQRVKTIEPKARIRTPIPPSTFQSSDRLFDFLIQKIRNAPTDEKSHILFREISDFVEKLEAIRSLLLCDDNTHSSVEYLDKHCSKIFGTQEGNYHISLDILDQLASGMDPAEFANNSATDANILPNQIDHNINASLSSISESKIHLVEGISEESLLKTVDDLMRKEGRMSNGNFDHIDSDNAVEAVTLKTTQPILNLSLDLFKFDGT
ncbi:uncharacterized protein LOC119067138 isoform X2 [Bradysia coprophila]|nr:uncharacterized protein LOC119067138 isoform X2 [Bradysia coprophila]